MASIRFSTFISLAMMLARLFITFWLLLSAWSLPGQSSHHSLQLEVAGRIGLIAGLTYEYRLSDDRFGLGTGLGFANYERNEAIRVLPNGEFEAGQAQNLYFSTPVYAFASLGKGAYRLHLPLNLLLLHESSRLEFPGESRINDYRKDLVGMLGVGFEYLGERWLLRATPYFSYLFSRQTQYFLFDDFFPWFGLTAGRRF